MSRRRWLGQNPLCVKSLRESRKPVRAENFNPRQLERIVVKLAAAAANVEPLRITGAGDAGADAGVIPAPWKCDADDVPIELPPKGRARRETVTNNLFVRKFQ